MKGKRMKMSRHTTSVHYAKFFGRIRPAVMDDFGTLIPLSLYNFYNLLSVTERISPEKKKKGRQQNEEKHPQVSGSRTRQE